MARLRLTLGLAVLAAALWLLAGHGLVNYDTLYAIDWGRDLGHGRLPDYDVPLAPTPHPLATLAGLVATPLSTAASDGVHGQITTTLALVVAFGSLAALGWLVYRLGAQWLHPAVGVLAALLLLTRRPVLDFGARGYVDLPYLVLVLGALLVESTRPRERAPVVLGLLAVAGLIRPEAWLFSGAYVLWTREWRLVPLAAVGPVGWAAFDLVTTGDPLHSFTGTHDNAEALGRVTGLRHVPTTAPRRIGEILRIPGLLAAAGGGVLTLLWLRPRVTLGAAAGVLSLIAFAILATAGLPILGRYLLLPAAILSVFAGAGVLGWLALPEGDARRRPWQAFGALCVVALVAFAPAQVSGLRQERRALRIQAGIQSDLADLIRDGTLPRACSAVAAPNRRPIPLLALWLDRRPQAIGTPADGVARAGAFLRTATPQVAHDYILDPRDPDQSVAAPPAGYRPVGGDASWRVLTRGCE